jgi:hypothetical protein
MLEKNIFGIIILSFNAIGLGYLFYLASLSIFKISSSKRKDNQAQNIPGQKKKAPLIIDDGIIPDEDDLLKDMDLSDLDNLNLDDFE